jgi:hypothetical protein
LNIARPIVSRHSSTITSSENSSPPSPNRYSANQATDDEFDADAGPSDINNNASRAASPVSLDEEFDGLDFQNRSRERALSEALHHLEVSRQMTMKNWSLLKMTRILFLESDCLLRQMTPMIPPMAPMGYRLLSMNILPFEMLMFTYSPTLRLGPPLMFNRRTALSHSIPPSPLSKTLAIQVKAWTIWQ